MNTITVKASKTYDILIGSGITRQAGSLIRKTVPEAKKAVIVSDDNVYPLYGECIGESLKRSGFEIFTFVFPHGEASKNLENYGKLLNDMCAAHFTRNDLTVALGGGVTGDLAGFAAATYRRGIHLVQMPSSLLASVDSSVGGKTAIDLPSGKNQAGCFYQPDLVICDTDMLSTLPKEEYRNGCAEIIKYAVLDNEGLFGKICGTPVDRQYEDVITRCVKIKKRLVEADEHDTGLRMLLNLGHTAGHAVETCSSYSIPHGQAVAMGLAAIVRGSEAKGICESSLRKEVVDLISAYGLPTELTFPADELSKAARADKKNTPGKMRLIVPAAIGDCRIITIDGTDFSGWLRAGGAL